MIKHVGYYINRTDIPGTTVLSIPIANCQRQCKDCHSPWLKESNGVDLLTNLPKLLAKFKDQIGGVCFLGEGNDAPALLEALKIVREADLDTALYSGADRFEDISLLYRLSPHFMDCELDFLKIGSNNDLHGDFNDPDTTNQRLYIHNEFGWQDITINFQSTYEELRAYYKSQLLPCELPGWEPPEETETESSEEGGKNEIQ